jgi:hypothetical protein
LVTDRLDGVDQQIRDDLLKLPVVPFDLGEFGLQGHD